MITDIITVMLLEVEERLQDSRTGCRNHAFGAVPERERHSYLTLFCHFNFCDFG